MTCVAFASILSFPAIFRFMGNLYDVHSGNLIEVKEATDAGAAP
jgi:hypothetical protein